jgi:hypothetical protein
MNLTILNRIRYIFVSYEFILTSVRAIMLQYFAIMLNYAQVWWQSYYAQNYAGIMCQGLTVSLLNA